MSTDRLRDQLKSSLGDAFTLIRELDPGGMARIFIAHERRLGRDVAVKVLSPQLAGGLNVERFAREIRVAAQLQEPHIVPLLAAGETGDGLPYYTMPYVAGQSLRKRLAEGPLAREEALKILADTARALAHAHEHGVVHRDIKPANVLLSSGTAVVTDFGIAKALTASRIRTAEHEAAEIAAADPFLTAAPPNDVTKLRTVGLTATGTGASLGTPAYMAPEQSIGDAVGPSADIYAWGVMAYELLSGAHPFADCTTPQQLLAAHLSAAPVPLSQKVRGLSRELATLVMRCLEKSPGRRPQTGAELLDALGRASTAPRVTRRERAAILAVATVGALGLIIGVESFARARNAEAAGPPLVAVLPFESVGTAADTVMISALEDALIGKLSRLSGLRVIDRQSVLVAQKRAVGALDVGRDLGADYVLRASVRWTTDERGMREALVTPTLVRVKNGTTKWAGDPERVRPADPFTVQATLATKLVDALDVALAPSERAALAQRATSDTAAYNAFARGVALRQHSRNAGWSTESLRDALRSFERAYRLDPRFADAYAQAAAMLRVLIAGGIERTASFDSLDVLARRAIALDPAQAEAVSLHAQVQWWSRGDLAGALRLVQRAAREQPSNAQLLVELAKAQGWAGDSGFTTTLRRAQRLAPRNTEILWQVMQNDRAARNYADKERLIRARIAQQPERIDLWMQLAGVAGGRGDSVAVAAAIDEYRARGGRIGPNDLQHLLGGGGASRRELAQASLASIGARSSFDTLTYYANKAMLYYGEGDSAKVRALADSALPIAERRVSDARFPLKTRRFYYSGVAWWRAVRGDRAEARAALDSARADPEWRTFPNGVVAMQIACTSADVYALLGDVDAMLPELRRCLTPPTGWYTERDLLDNPVFRRYSDDPRVRALLPKGG
jgi:serine/threonine-protein kinase